MKRRMLTIVIAIVFVAAMFVGGTVAGAASGDTGIINIVPNGSSGPNTHQFTVKNNSGEGYNFALVDFASGSPVGGGGWLDPGASVNVTATYSDNEPHEVMAVVTDGTYVNSASWDRTSSRYQVLVNYVDVATGAVLGSASDYVAYGQSVTFNGPPTLTDGSGTGYERVNGYGATVSYGQTAPATIQYKKIVNDPIYVNIRFVDEYDQSIGSKNGLEVQYGKSLTQAIDGKITYNGKEYTLDAGQPTVITHDYSLGGKTYTIRYTSVPTKAVAFRVVYVDPSGKTLVTNTATVAGGGSTTFQTATTYTAANGQTYARVAGQPTAITQAYDSATTMYTVQYEPIKATGEYQIAINYVNAITGKVIDTKYETVPVNQAARHPFPRTLSIGGTDYVVSNGQGNEIIHTYGEAKRVYTVYYNEQGENAPVSYEITMKFVNIADGKTEIASRKTATVTATAAGKLPAAAATITGTDGNTYRMLDNQDEFKSEITHDYYDAKHVYTVYYRDINASNQAGRVETGPNGERIIYTDEGTVLTEAATGEAEEPAVEPEPEIPIEQIVEEQTPLEQAQGDGETANPENIDDNQTALSDAVKEANEATGGWLLWGIIIAAAAVGVILIVVFARKKKKATDNMNASH